MREALKYYDKYRTLSESVDTARCENAFMFVLCPEITKRFIKPELEDIFERMGFMGV